MELLPLAIFCATFLANVVCYLDWSTRRDADKRAARYRALQLASAQGTVERTPRAIAALWDSAARNLAAGLTVSAAWDAERAATLQGRLDRARAILAA